MQKKRYVEKLVRKAKDASYRLAKLSPAQKNSALKAMAKALVERQRYILAANEKDVRFARKNNVKASFIERLTLTEKRIHEMAVSLRAIAALDDPVGKTISRTTRPNGIKLSKIRVPIGVVLIIYEARPNVTSDCVGLLFKTSNVGILRGGAIAQHSNQALSHVLKKALKESGIDFEAFFVVEKTEHAVVDLLLKQNDYIDLVIPRGGEALIRKVVESSHIPVIKHYKGVCHIFVDSGADMKKAVAICVNAKAQRPSVCNAVETILVHEKIAKRFLPLLKQALAERNVRIRADAKTRTIIRGVEAAQASDWTTEYLDLIVSIKIVKDVDEAIAHINTYGSHHTESILTKNRNHARKFLKEIDSACCFLNMSTRFSDGFQFGLGAEIGISTDKLHARGPMGLEELTTYKWIGEGNGQIRT